MNLQILLRSALLLLLISQHSPELAAKGFLCRNVFSDNLIRIPHVQTRAWDTDSMQWKIDKESLLPYNINESTIFNRDEVEASNMSFYGINEMARSMLLQHMGTNSRLVVTPLGPSLWELSQLRDWLYLGETRILRDPTAAQEAIEAIAVSTENALHGFPRYWVNELFTSSQRLEDTRQMALAGFEKRVYSSLKTALHNLTTIVNKNRSDRSAITNSFEFDWGAGPRWVGSSEMAPSTALSVARTLAVMALLDRTFVFSSGRYEPLEMGNIINLETKLFLATYPEYFPLIGFFESYPIGIGSSYRIGSEQATVELFPSIPIEYQNIRFNIASIVSNTGIKLDLVFEKDSSLQQKEQAIDHIRQIMITAWHQLNEALGRTPDNEAPFYFNLLGQDRFELKMDGLANHELAIIHINLLRRLSPSLSFSSVSK